MYSRHNQVPAYQVHDAVIEATRFNQVQIALKRLGEEIRLMIPGLKRVDMILQKDAWIVVDRSFDDLPIAAWVEFAILDRSALHTPVICRLKHYHANAGILTRRVLDPIGQLLDYRLKKSKRDHQVINLTGRN